MTNQIIALKNIWKIGIVALAFSAIAAFSLIFYTKGVLASYDSGDCAYEESEDDSSHEDWDCDEEEEPSPTPAPQGGQEQGQEQEQNQETNVNVNVEQKQENNQTVNVTVPQAQVAGASNIPVKQPETGAGVLGMASVAGAGPLGLLLARYGRGRIASRKEEESLSEIGFNLTETRKEKNLS